MIRSLKLVNFRSHESSLFNFHERLNVIAGPCGGGKTSTMYGLAACIVGANELTDAGGAGLEDLIRRDTDYMELEVSIVDASGVMLDIRRVKFARGDEAEPGKHSLYASCSDSARVTTVQENIITALGFRKRDALLELLDVRGVCTRDVKEQMASMLGVMQAKQEGIDIPPYILPLLERHLKIKAVSSVKHIASLSSLADEKRKDEKRRLEDLAPHAPKSRPEISDEDPTEKEIKTDISTFDKERTALLIKKGNIEGMRKQFALMKEEPVTDDERNRIDSDRQKISDADLSGMLATTEATMRHAQQQKGSIEARRSAVASDEKRIATLLETMPLVVEEKEISAAELALVLIRDEEIKATEELTTINAALQRVRADLSSIPVGNKPVCPTCFRNITSSAWKALKEQFESTANSLSEDLVKAQGALDSVLTRTRIKKAAILELKARHRKYADVSSALSSANNQLEMNLQALTTELPMLEDLNIAIGKCDQKILSLRSELECRVAFDRRYRAYTEWCARRDLVEKQEQQLPGIAEQILTLESRTNDARVVLTMRQDIDRQSTLYDDWKRQDALVAELEAVSKWLGPKGVRRELFAKWSGPFLNEMIKASASFERIRTISIDETEGLIVNDSRAEMLSAGEKMIFEWTYRVAMARFTGFGVVAIDGDAIDGDRATLDTLIKSAAQIDLQSIILLQTHDTDFAGDLVKGVDGAAYWCENGVVELL